MTFASLLAHAAEEAGHHGGNVQAQTFWIGASMRSSPSMTRAMDRLLPGIAVLQTP